MKDLNKEKSIENLENNISRRRRNISKAGMVTPVIMTLLNRPAWGATRTMCSVSGFDSANVQAGGAVFSGMVDPNETCTGVHSAIEPNVYWADNSNSPANFDLETRFKDIFNAGHLGGNPRFRRVLRGNATNGTSRDIAYASLYVDAVEANAAGVPFVLGSPSDVVNIYAGDFSFFSAYGWSTTEVDSFIAYLLNHPI